MSAGKLLFTLNLMLIVAAVLFTVLSLILIVLVAAQQRSGIRIRNLKKRVADLLVTYCHEYYVPFNASIAEATLALGEYHANPTSENRFKVRKKRNRVLFLANNALL
jgi:hypothetical protein